MKARRIILYVTTILMVLLCTAAGLVLPGIIATAKSNKDNSVVQHVPEKYYEMKSIELAKKASDGLTSDQKKRLVTGEWDSVLTVASASEMEKTGYEMYITAKKAIHSLKEQGRISFDVESEFGQWYYWETRPYKAVEKIFNTYVAVFWQIIFTRSDNKEHHTITLLEDGTIVYLY